MLRLKEVSLALALLLVACAGAMRAGLGTAPESAVAGDEEPRVEDVRRLMALAGTGNLGVQVFNQMLPGLRKLVPAAPEEFWAAFRAKFRPEDMVELVIPIYRRHLSARDVRGLIAFYESPVGRRFVQVQPAIVKESMETGGEWGRKIAREAIEEARAHGYRTGPQ